MLSIHIFILLTLFNILSANSCKLHVYLHQELHNEGFHRNLTYKITFSELNTITLLEECSVGLDQFLPPGVFADPDELDDLLRMDRLTAIPKNRVNTELMGDESDPSSVFVIGQAEQGEVDMWLPVHARYQPPTEGGGFYYNRIDKPRMYIRCPPHKLDECAHKALATFPCSGASRKICVWNEMYVTRVSKPAVELEVPVGDLNHYNFVASGTAATLMIFSLYLLKTLHEYTLTIKKR